MVSVTRKSYDFKQVCLFCLHSKAYELGCFTLKNKKKKKKPSKVFQFSYTSTFMVY